MIFFRKNLYKKSFIINLLFYSLFIKLCFFNDYTIINDNIYKQIKLFCWLSKNKSIGYFDFARKSVTKLPVVYSDEIHDDLQRSWKRAADAKTEDEAGQSTGGAHSGNVREKIFPLFYQNLNGQKGTIVVFRHCGLKIHLLYIILTNSNINNYYIHK